MIDEDTRFSTTTSHTVTLELNRSLNLNDAQSNEETTQNVKNLEERENQVENPTEQMDVNILIKILIILISSRLSRDDN